MACWYGGLREPSRHFGTNFGASLYFFKGPFLIRHMKDYAMAAVNGTLARRRDAHFVGTIGTDHKQAIAGEGFRVLAGGVVENHSGLQL
jgi:hypothetical protein